jgi:hypothetical protein
VDVVAHALGTLRQKDHKFETSLGHIARTFHKNEKKRKEKEITNLP